MKLGGMWIGARIDRQGINRLGINRGGTPFLKYVSGICFQMF